jgi:hypothetical protein
VPPVDFSKDNKGWFIIGAIDIETAMPARNGLRIHELAAIPYGFATPVR